MDKKSYTNIQSEQLDLVVKTVESPDTIKDEVRFSSVGGDNHFDDHNYRNGIL